MKVDNIKNINRLTALLFVSLLAIPLALTFKPADGTSENRVLTGFPSIEISKKSLTSFPKRFEGYINDNFGLRNLFLDLNAEIVNSVFGATGSKDVIIGKNGWLFFAGDKSLPDILGNDPFGLGDIEKWKISTLEKGRWLASSGVEYRFVLAPDKHTVYPDYLPENIKFSGHPRADVVRNLGLQYFVDLAPDLRRARSGFGDRLYFQTDTHWKSFGAYVGFEGIVRSLGTDFERRAIKFQGTDFGRRGAAHKRDLASIARMPTVEVDETVVASRLPKCRSLRAGQPPLGLPSATTLRMLTVTCEGGKGTALVFHDSYMQQIMPFMSPLFERVVYIWDNPDDDVFVRMVLQEKPDVVIEERVERFFRTPPQAQLGGALAKLNDEAVRGYTAEAEQQHIRLHELMKSGARVSSDKQGMYLTLNAATHRIEDSGGVVESANGAIGGYVIDGWAGFPASKQGADHILVTVDDVAAMAVPLTKDRMDVAEHFQAPALSRSGFTFFLPADVLETVARGGSIKLLAGQNGRYALMDARALEKRLRADAGL